MEPQLTLTPKALGIKGSLTSRKIQEENILNAISLSQFDNPANSKISSQPLVKKS